MSGIVALYLAFGTAAVCLFIRYAAFHKGRHPIVFRVVTVAFRSAADPAENIAAMTDIIHAVTSSDMRADLIVFGEMAVCRYDCDADYIESVSMPPDDALLKTLTDTAASLNVNLSFGFPEREGNRFYNSQMLAGRDGGIITVHRKHNLTAGESAVFSPGASPITVVELEKIKTGLAICYDMMAPGYRYAVSERRPELLVHSLADPQDPRFITGLAGRMSACWYVSANRFGKEKGMAFNGHISFVNPWGDILDLHEGWEQFLSRNIHFDLNEKKYVHLVRSCFLRARVFFHIILYFPDVLKYVLWTKRNS